MLDTHLKTMLRVTVFGAILTTCTISSAAQGDEDTIVVEQASSDAVGLIPQAKTLRTQETLKGEAKQLIGMFATQLKGELVAAIQAGGFDNAVEVCQSKAPEIAKSLSVDGWTIGRTSLQVRNTDNSPDSWESKILHQFDERLTKGESIQTLSFSAIEDEQFRMMKAIPVGNVCLACHGSSIDTATSNKINKLYPADKAIGYSIGDLRGAFTVQKELSE
jgi:hypothetical protein